MLFWPSVFEHGHWRLSPKTERKREIARRGKRGKEQGSGEEEYILLQTEERTIRVMFNAGGSGQGSEGFSFMSHLTHLQSSHRI